MKAFIVVGTRPEAIKLAPVIQECKGRHRGVEPIVCFTGQHREMLTQIAEYFDIRPDLNIDVMRPNQSLASLTSRCLTGLEEAVQKFEPDCIVAQGDTTTVLAASVIAMYQKTPFVHVEAGLRTGNLLSPWPEEFNRRVASIATSVHWCATAQAAENLRSEGIADEIIHITGNTVIDALLSTVRREQGRNVAWEEKYAFLKRPRLVLITGHRRENFGRRFQGICRAIQRMSARFEEVDFVYPVHLNPNVREPVRRLLGNRDNVHLLEPLGYPDFVWLMNRCYLILSDSGGVQEEAPSLKKPVLVTRDTTERPEAVSSGAVELVGSCEDRIVQQVTLLLSDAKAYARRQIDNNPYGDGSAAPRIVDLIMSAAAQPAPSHREVA